VSRGFVRKIPEEETRVKVFTVVTKEMPKLNRLRGILDYSHSLSKVKGIVARVIKMSLSGKEVRQKYTPEQRDHEARKEMLSAMDYERATNLIYFLAMKQTDKAVKEGRLKALYPIELKDKNNIGHNGLWLTRGRLGKGLTKMFGI
jgi:hypothetical protein